jgi:hypothetical protein
LLAGDNTWCGSTDAESVRLKRREIADRYRKRFDRDTKRLIELYRLASDRHGDILPDDDQGRLFAFVMAHHLAEPNRIRANLAELAPWYDDDDADKLIKAVAKRRYRWSADKLASAKWLNVSYAERQALGLTTIGAFDVPKAEREKLRRERYRPRKRTLDRAWRQRRRRKQGKPTRDAWLQDNSASRDKPWLALGIGRTKYYALKRAECLVAGAVVAPPSARTGPSFTYTVSKRERTTCPPPRQRLAPKRQRHHHVNAKSPSKRQRRMAVRAGSSLAAQAPPQSPASVPATLTSPWRVTVSDRLLSRPGAA